MCHLEEAMGASREVFIILEVRTNKQITFRDTASCSSGTGGGKRFRQGMLDKTHND